MSSTTATTTIHGHLHESELGCPESLADRLLKPSEVAPLLGVTTGYLANLRSRGEGISYVKVGSAVRYRASHVARYIAANTVYTVEVMA